MYGPVAGSGRFKASFPGVSAGTAKAMGSASFIRKSGSGSRRWKVTVRAFSSMTIPRERSQRGGSGAHAERVSASAVRRLRDRKCEVGHELAALDPADAAPGDQPIVGPENVPSGHAQGIEREPLRRGPDGPQRSASMRLAG